MGYLRSLNARKRIETWLALMMGKIKEKKTKNRCETEEKTEW